MVSIGLVLGAGGVTGGAFHAGVLAALADTTGWDARAADIIVGTSAGSLTASALRAGLAPADLHRRNLGEDLSAEGQTLVARVTTPWHMGKPVRNSRRPASPLLIARGLLRPGPVRPVVSLAGALPRGTLNADAMAQRTQEMRDGDPWPTRPTWIAAARLNDGARVVFGRDDVDVPNIGVAVQASCAVPSVFEPVSIAGTEYVDGGIVSPTNAELVAPLRLDLVIISSPMSAIGASFPSSGLSRSWHHRTLQREVRAIRGSGTPVLVIEPDRSVLDAAGPDNMDGTRNPAVGQAAWAATRRAMTQETATDAVDLLREA